MSRPLITVQIAAIFLFISSIGFSYFGHASVACRLIAATSRRCMARITERRRSGRNGEGSRKNPTSLHCGVDSSSVIDFLRARIFTFSRTMDHSMPKHESKGPFQGRSNSASERKRQNPRALGGHNFKQSSPVLYTTCTHAASVCLGDEASVVPSTLLALLCYAQYCSWDGVCR